VCVILVKPVLNEPAADITETPRSAATAVGFIIHQNRVMRKVLGSERDELAGEWRRLHNKEIHQSFFSIHQLMYK
jgi:hypothetical protein